MAVRPMTAVKPIQPTALAIQPVRLLAMTPTLDRGSMTKKWTTRRTRHRRIMRVRARKADKLAIRKMIKYQAQIKRRQDMVDSIWKQYGLTEAPEFITERQRNDLTKRYIEDGCFNEVLSPVEIRNYMYSTPHINCDLLAPNKPRQFRHSETHPYLGVNIPIPLERMKDPKTGKHYKPEDIAKYQTDRHKHELAQLKRRGQWAWQRAKNATGFVSLRDTKEFHNLGRRHRLDPIVAKTPYVDPRFRQQTKFLGKRNMFFAHRGYYDREFQMPWRFFHINARHGVEEYNLLHPTPFTTGGSEYGWRSAADNHFDESHDMQMKARLNRCSALRQFQVGYWKKGRIRRDYETLLQMSKDHSMKK